MKIWQEIKNLQIKTSDDVVTGLDYKYDKSINDETVLELEKFNAYLLKKYQFPICLVIDFVDKYYLVTPENRQSGYIFSYDDVTTYPDFSNIQFYPYVKLPVKGYNEKWTKEEILSSYIEAITDYFAWLLGKINEEYYDEEEIYEILDEYLGE